MRLEFTLEPGKDRKKRRGEVKPQAQEPAVPAFLTPLGRGSKGSNDEPVRGSRPALKATRRVPESDEVGNELGECALAFIRGSSVRR
jgi:hypothetical protein